MLYHRKILDIPFTTITSPRKGYSGTAIFSKEQPLSVSEDFPAANMRGGQGDYLRVRRFLFGQCLCSQFQGDLSRLGYRYESWDPDLKDYLIELRAKKPVILCGDLNVAHREIDLANPKTNAKAPALLIRTRRISNLFAEGFLDTFRHLYPDLENAYSWWSYRAGARARNVGWRIDYFVVSDDLATSVRDATILAQVEGSDHCPVGLSLTQVGFS